MREIAKIKKYVMFSVALVSVITILGGCAQLIGRPDEGDLPDPSRPVRLRYVETLRNEASLISERYLQTDPLAPAATSLQKPVSAAADMFRVYVVDRSPQPRLFIFDRGERLVKIISSPTPTAVNTLFLDPSAVAVDDAGDIYVADPAQGKVLGLDRGGNLIFTLGKTGSLVYPAAIAVDTRRHRIYVADKHAHKVLVYTTRGDWLSDMGGHDAKDGLRTPIGLALDSAGNIFVLDAHRNRVHVFDGEGVLLKRFSLVTDLAHPLNNPTGIAVDTDGHVYVSDSIANTILLFDQNGMNIQRWGGTGNQRDGFLAPAGIFIDDRNYIYISDQMNGRIQVYQYEK